MKNFNVIKTVISVISIILVVLSICNIINRGISVSIVVTLLGSMSILDGYSSYIKNKKREATFLFLCGLFMIFISIFTKFFRNV
ncbi:DUF308 domain-containing protein [Clostridium bowmanii]|uniref:DUF308 domain-containing protein n=1 Tax=Clostridium bowmanii TaxID=132925 RepID=UPI001C0E1E65|nr:DUF308 domain-containing protein [Clostridium bowmanii]MBU3188298.1 DUF308 domain-containing protein [Clostridium bowmanii]MCA1072686.1 DUF308 domain-containing protein [Clostridium bowmanii]